MTTLALDLATTTGFAIARDDGRIESGTEVFGPRSNEGPGGRFLRMRRWLVDTKAAHDPLRLIAFERVHHVGEGQAYAAQLYGGFLAVVLMFAEHHQIECRGYQIQKIKQAWTGKGNAKKPDMIARCRELGFNPVDDNEADAIALLHVALDRVPQLPPERLVKPKPARRKADTKTRELAVDPF